MNRLLPLIALLPLAACTDEIEYEGAFVVPTPVGVVAPDAATPFGEEPVGYVASQIGGSIHALALRQGRFLNDDATASFLRASPLATGGARVLTSVSPWAPSSDRITVFAADQGFGHLLEVPHVVGVDDLGPLESALEISEVTSSGSATLEDLEIAQGYAATETWTLTFDGTRWWVEGSRSGAQEFPAEPGEAWSSADLGISFTVVGGTEVGETITFSTDSGLIEHDLDDAPVSVSTAPDQSLVALITADDAGDGHLAWWDPTAGALAGQVTLPEGADPVRMTWSEDTLFVADGGLPTVYTLAIGETEPEVIDLPWPVLDVAPAPETGMLWVVPVSGSSVWGLDLETGALRDLNPWRDGVDGLEVYSAIQGIEAVPMRTALPELDDEDVTRWGHALAISLYAGPVILLDQERGCLVKSPLGPRTRYISDTSARGDYQVSFTTVSDSPFLALNVTNNRHALVNDCAGIAPSEQWTLTYDSLVQGWRVEGALSGVQEGIAFEDVRYVSDGGEVSFRVRGGASPSQDGYRMVFTVLDGRLEIMGDSNGDELVTSDNAEIGFSLPADPVAITYRPEPGGAGWQQVDETAALVVPLQGIDTVSRVQVSTGLVDAVWR